MAKDEHLFLCLLVIRVSSLEKCLLLVGLFVNVDITLGSVFTPFAPLPVHCVFILTLFIPYSFIQSCFIQQTLIKLLKCFFLLYMKMERYNTEKIS